MLTKGEDVGTNCPPAVPTLVVLLKILVEKAELLVVCWLNEWLDGCCPIAGEGEDGNSPAD
jgi:hypothetical protein